MYTFVFLEVIMFLVQGIAYCWYVTKDYVIGALEYSINILMNKVLS